LKDNELYQGVFFALLQLLAFSRARHGLSARNKPEDRKKPLEEGVFRTEGETLASFKYRIADWFVNHPFEEIFPEDQLAPESIALAKLAFGGLKNVAQQALGFWDSEIELQNAFSSDSEIADLGPARDFVKSIAKDKRFNMLGVQLAYVGRTVLQG